MEPAAPQPEGEGKVGAVCFCKRALGVAAGSMVTPRRAERQCSSPGEQYQGHTGPLSPMSGERAAGSGVPVANRQVQSKIPGYEAHFPWLVRGRRGAQ